MPADREPPSYEVLSALVVSLRGELARAQERIAELEDRLRKTSRNSSRPPSGDGLAKPPPRSRSLRRKTGRKPGGQDGHPGQALAELFDIPLSPGTVAALTARAAGKLDGFVEQVSENITVSDVAGFDETGFRVAGRLHWVHCARTGKYTLLMVHPRRGRQAMEAMGILPSFAGIAVHDAWAPYDTYSGPEHQLCCAHALRELQAVTDSAPAGGWCWAAQAAEALTGMQALVSEAIARGRDAVDPAALAAQIHRYRSAALLGPARPRRAPAS